MDVLGPQPIWLRSGHWEKPTSLRIQAAGSPRSLSSRAQGEQINIQECSVIGCRQIHRALPPILRPHPPFGSNWIHEIKHDG